VEDEVAEPQQQVLPPGLDALEAASVEALYPGRAAARVGRGHADPLTGQRPLDAPGRPEDGVALGHELN